MKDFFKQNNETKGLKTFVGNIKNGMEHCNVKAGLSFRTRKKNQAKKLEDILNSSTNYQKTQGNYVWENSIYQNFFRITLGFSRKF